MNKRTRAFSPASQTAVSALKKHSRLSSHMSLDKENIAPSNKKQVNLNKMCKGPLVKAAAVANQSTSEYDSLLGMVIEVEGNIGSGKSTVQSKMHQVIGSSQCEKFGEIVNNDFLGAFYGNPKKFGFAFQMYMLTTRLWQMQDAARLAHEENKCCFLDRGAAGDALFAILSHKNGNMDDEEMNIYKSVCNERLPNDLGTKIDAVLYLDVDPRECHRRIHSIRKNDAESGVPLEYLDSVDECYFELNMCWLGGGQGIHDMNVGPCPKMLVMAWDKFGETEVAMKELSRLVQGKRDGPSVRFLSTKPSTTAASGSSRQEFSCIYESSEAISSAFEGIQSAGPQLCSGTLAREREVVAVDWSLPHDNAFRRVISYWLTRDACILCYNAASMMNL